MVTLFSKKIMLISVYYMHDLNVAEVARLPTYADSGTLGEFRYTID